MGSNVQGEAPMLPFPKAGLLGWRAGSLPMAVTARHVRLATALAITIASSSGAAAVGTVPAPAAAQAAPGFGVQFFGQQSGTAKGDVTQTTTNNLDTGLLQQPSVSSPFPAVLVTATGPG